jgi:hypothetical protein
MKNAFSGPDTDSKISKYKDIFERIRRGLTELGVVEIETRLDDIGVYLDRFSI